MPGIARYRFLSLLFIPLLALSALFVAGPGAAQAAASLSLSRQTIARGDTVTVSGSGFAANDVAVVTADITILQHGARQPQHLQVNTRTNEGGSFSLALPFPGNTVPGSYKIQARDSSGHSASTGITVLPLAVLRVGAKQIPTTVVVAGQYFFASGSGFTPGATVRLTVVVPQYNGNSVTVNRSPTTDAHGAFHDVLMRVPFDARAATVVLTATGPAHKAAANIGVVYRPRLTLDSAGNRPGGSVTVFGTGFVPLATIHVSLPIQNGAATDTLSRDVTADATGNFTTSFNLPVGARLGTYTVTATGSVAKFTASTQLKISLQPVVMVSPKQVAPGQSAKVSGSGFSANVSVQVSVTFPLYGGGTRVVTKTFHTGPHGAFAGTIQVPGHAAAGTVTVTAAGPSAHIHAFLEILHVGAAITVSPSSIAPGSTLTINGSGYPAGDHVAISVVVRLVDGSTQTLATSATAGAHGAFKAHLHIPGTAVVGSYQVVARSESTGRAPTARFSLGVSAHISLLPSSTQPGGVITVTGRGFGADVPVTLNATFPLYTGGSRTVTITVRSDASGSLVAHITVPHNAAAGPVTITAHGPNARVSAPFTVAHINASVATSPNAAIPGSTIQVRGYGYLSGAKVDISMTVKTLSGGSQTLTASAVANSKGQFTVSLRIPANAVGGTYTLVARSELSGRAPHTMFSIVKLAPSIIAAPATAMPGTQITVNGFAFSAGASITLTLNGQKVGTATASGAGQFTVKVTVPASIASGAYTLAAQGSSGRHASFKLTVNRQFSTHFYFASFYTGTGYSENIAILNPSAIQARVTITYDLKSGATTTKTATVRPFSRYTENVNADLGFHVSAAAVVSADVPVVASRFVYHNTDMAIVPAVTSPATSWFFANGNTSGRYREYIAVQNPNNSTVQVSFRLLPTHHRAFTIHRTMAPTSRTTIKVNSFVRDAVGVVVRASAPVVANRTLYIHHGMTSKIGVPAPQRSWYFAGGPRDTRARNYIGVINPNRGWAHVTLHLYDPTGQEVGTTGGWLRPFARVAYQTNRLVHRTDVAAVLTSSRAVVAEQTTYVGRMHDAATDTFGVVSPTRSWAFPAVDTSYGRGASDVLDLFNPSLVPVPVVVQFMTTSGTVTQRTYVVAPLGHQIVDVGSVAPNTQLGLVATSSAPFVALNQAFVNNHRGSDTSHGMHL